MFNFQQIKDQVTELDKKTRTMVGLLNKIHSTPSGSSQIYTESLVLHDLVLNCLFMQSLLYLIPSVQFSTVVRVKMPL